MCRTVFLRPLRPQSWVFSCGSESWGLLVTVGLHTSSSHIILCSKCVPEQSDPVDTRPVYDVFIQLCSAVRISGHQVKVQSCSVAAYHIFGVKINGIWLFWRMILSCFAIINHIYVYMWFSLRIGMLPFCFQHPGTGSTLWLTPCVWEGGVTWLGEPFPIRCETWLQDLMVHSCIPSRGVDKSCRHTAGLEESGRKGTKTSQIHMKGSRVCVC